jgi:hypothetical protein
MKMHSSFLSGLIVTDLSNRRVYTKEKLSVDKLRIHSSICRQKASRKNQHTRKKEYFGAKKKKIRNSLDRHFKLYHEKRFNT